MKRIALITVAGLAAGVSAQVIDFQALEHVDGNTTDHGSTYSEDGFTLNGPNLTTFGTQEGRYPGSTAIFSNRVSGLIEVVQDGGGIFGVASVDLVPLNNGNAPVTVTFNGEVAGGIVATQQFTTSSIGFVLETFNFSGDFGAIDRLTWTQDSPFNQVDNITMIPAPASLALLGLGGLVATRRRR